MEDLNQINENDLELKNDYCQHFVNTKERPQNFIKDHEKDKRFKEYPKINELIYLKDNFIKERSHPMMFIKSKVRDINLENLGKFDVILIDPPLIEYKNRIKNLPYFTNESEKFEGWTVDEIKSLKINSITNVPSFVFLWVGSDHLEHGREIFKHWGFKRCEDIVWIKTNKKRQQGDPYLLDKCFLKRTKEHCLLGYKGDNKKASDPNHIHPNIDIDVLVDEEYGLEDLTKPKEFYETIERLCLGRRKLELFGDNNNLRDGWLTVGNMISNTNYDPTIYNDYFKDYPTDSTNKKEKYYGGKLMGTTNEIESLRPKSPK